MAEILKKPTETLSDAFLRWSLHFNENLELDRKDDNGDYCKENCRWVTHQENCRNRRNAKYITIGSETKRVVEWADQYQVPQSYIHGRLKNGYIGLEAVLGKQKDQ